jgi:hypothetical protein
MKRAFVEERSVLFMVVERFTPAAAVEIYRRVREDGRSIPDGLRYVDSWVRADLGGDDLLLLQEWIAGWGDLVEFEIVPVTPSSSTQELMAR